MHCSNDTYIYMYDYYVQSENIKLCQSLFEKRSNNCTLLCV